MPLILPFLFAELSNTLYFEYLQPVILVKLQGHEIHAIKGSRNVGFRVIMCSLSVCLKQVCLIAAVVLRDFCFSRSV